MKLYRGISVSESEVEMVIQDIMTNGLYQNDKQTWGGFIWKNLKKEINTLYNKEDLTREDTSPASVCIETKNSSYMKYTEGELSMCFADKIGAEYYATSDLVLEPHKIPLLITVDLDIENIAIDGRDFLRTVFSYIGPKDIKKAKRLTQILKKIFGVKIEKYIEKIFKHPNSENLAIYDLVICDNEIIADHSRNTEIIGGRYETIFRSAFFGKIPIPREKILNVEILKDNIQIKSPTIILNDILWGSRIRT